MAKQTGSCAYCSKYGDLEESHILPKWTIRRTLRASVTGKLRDSENVNKRVQDGEKVSLLCRDCENTFSKLEGLASRSFDAGEIAHDAAYTDDFVRFLTSILWRGAIVRTADVQSAHPKFSTALATALQVWKDVLDGKRTDFDGHPIWFAMLDTNLAMTVDRFMKSQSTDGRGAAPVINRFFANFFEVEVAVSENEGVALVWAKTTFSLILGVLAAPSDPAGVPMEMSLLGGRFPSANHPVPDAVLAFLGLQSWQYLKETWAISSEQRQKIKDDWIKNVAKVPGSAQEQARQADIAMFGDDAFVNAPEPDEE